MSRYSFRQTNLGLKYSNSKSGFNIGVVHILRLNRDEFSYSNLSFSIKKI